MCLTSSYITQKPGLSILDLPIEQYPNMTLYYTLYLFIYYWHQLFRHVNG